MILIVLILIFFYFFINSKECYEQECKTEWSEWSKCSKECGGGSQEREREMKVMLMGGYACPRLVEKKECNIQAC